MMNKQLDIEFFWPLTEQVPLDLDYTDCVKPQYTTKSSDVFSLIDPNASYTICTTGGSGNLVIDVESAVFKLAEEPPLYRKVLYKLMNIRWEKK
jgi:hypothetical protein